MSTKYKIKKGDTQKKIILKYRGNYTFAVYKKKLEADKDNSNVKDWKHLNIGQVIYLPWSRALDSHVGGTKTCTKSGGNSTRNKGACVPFDCFAKKNTKLKKGYISHKCVTKKVNNNFDRGKMQKIQAIVLHRTSIFPKSKDPKNGKSILQYINSVVSKADGAHFYIAMDGTIYQTVSLFRKTQHVGGYRLYSKDWAKYRKGKYKNQWGKHRYHQKRAKYEMKHKSYPQRYPLNAESVGIEVHGSGKVVGKVSFKESEDIVGYGPQYKGEDKIDWMDVTKEQMDSIVCLCKFLMLKYGLTKDDIYAHEAISVKKLGEALFYKADVLKRL